MIKNPLKLQTFNDGLVEIYEAVAPRTIAATPICTLRFHQRTVGVKRYYAAQQANAKIEHLLRCPFLKSVKAENIAILGGEQFRVSRAQKVEDVHPPCMDLTLENVIGDYEKESL